MKKVLLSLFLAFVCLPIAFGQAFDRPIVTTSETACGSFTWAINNVTYTSDTTVLVISDSAVYVLDLTIRTASGDTTDFNDTANCVYVWNDSVWKTPGYHIGILEGSDGCDSIVRVNLYLSMVDTAILDTVVCDSVLAPWGEMVTESVNLISTYTTAEGCDRVDSVNIVVGHSFSTYEEIDAEGCRYNWNGFNINDTNVRTYKYYTRVGHCDSVYNVKVNLSFLVYDSTEVTECGSYTFYGQNLTTTGTYVHNDTTGKCVTSHVLDLTINPVYNNPNPVVRDVTAGCFYAWGDSVFTDTNVVHVATVRSISGCDSIGAIRIINYTNEEFDELDTVYCGTQFSWRGQNRTTDGNYYDTTVAEGCTTYHHLALAFTYRYDTVAPVTRCATYTFDFGGHRNGQGFGTNDRATFTESGLYTTDTTYNDPLFPESNLYIKNPNNGCITFLALPLTIVSPEQRYRGDTTVITACDKYTFKVGNATSPIFTTDTTGYTLIYENHSTIYADANRCYDSIGILNLTIKHSTNIDTVVSACDTFYWAFADTTFFHSEDYRKVMADSLNEDGCPFYGHLSLTLQFTPNVYIDGDWMLKPGESTTLRAVCTTPNVGFQWYKDNVAVSTDSSIVVEAPQNGSNVNVHLVTTVRNENCPANNWLTVTFTNVGIDEAENIGVDIYPNPATRIVNVSCAEAIRQIVIYNTVGQQVLLNNNGGNKVQLDLGNLTSGAYTMSVLTADGNQATRKLIVSK